MFNGLIAHRGTVAENEPAQEGGRRLLVDCASAIADGVEPKDSISIDGACLTAIEVRGSAVLFDVVPETVSRSTLGTLSLGAAVNVELSLRLGERIGGHLVYGHVDATTAILGKEREGEGWRLVLETPASLAAAIVEKGYVSIDGVSLTIARTEHGRFAIALIPETARRTNLGHKDVGARVNLEIDPIARYALGALAHYEGRGATSEELEWAYEI